MSKHNGIQSHRWQEAPELREVLLLVACSAVLFGTTVSAFATYSSAVYNFGDSHAYTLVATAISHWSFGGLQIKQFWGYPYAVAALSVVTGVPEQASLVLVSVLSSLLSIVLAHKLWNGWVAALFALLNFDWLQRTFLGGSEPLAVALILAAFLAVRRERYLLASLFAALSTVVRPLGFFSLLAIGIVLIYRREYKKLVGAILIGAIVGTLYALPLLRYFGDALATVHSYSGGQLPLFGIPFYAIVKGTILYPAPWTNLILDFGWIALVLAGTAAMWLNPEFREYARRYPVEVLFAVPFLLTVFCYNYPVFARSNFARFAIPVLPIILLALSRWMPKDRRLLWALGCVSPILAACSALGIRNVAHRLLG